MGERQKSQFPSSFFDENSSQFSKYQFDFCLTPFNDHFFSFQSLNCPIIRKAHLYYKSMGWGCIWISIVTICELFEWDYGTIANKVSGFIDCWKGHRYFEG